MRLTITQKLALTISLFVVSGSAIVIFFILPALASIRQATESMAAHITSENNELERLRLLRRSLTEIDQIETNVATLDAVSISRSDEDEIIKRLETLASTHNVEQELSVSYNAEGGSPDFAGYYVFHFATQGSFSNIRAYLASLEQLPYYFIIPKMSIEKVKDGDPTQSHVIIQFSAILNSTSS